MMYFVRLLALPILRWYWKVFNPKTYGVKVVIQHPESKTILVVRHNYGDKTIWSLPGGGYWPKWESSQSAAKREVKEEVGLEIVNLVWLGEYKTTAQGKRDTVTIFSGQAQSTQIVLNSEISEFKWMLPQAFDDGSPIHNISKYAIRLLDEKLN